MKQYTFLVLEDVARIRQNIADELEDAGYKVIEAATTEEAIKAIETHEIDALSSDIRIDAVGETRDGIDVAKIFREKYGNGVAIFFYSAFTDNLSYKERAAALGPVAFLSKGDVDIEKINEVFEQALLNRLREEEQKVVITNDGRFFIPIRKAGELWRNVILHIDDINYIHGSEGITTFYAADNKSYILGGNAAPIIRALENAPGVVTDVLYKGIRGKYINLSKIIAFDNGHVFFDIEDVRGVSVSASCIQYLSTRFPHVNTNN